MKMLRLMLLAALLIPVSGQARDTDIPARIALREQSGVAEVVLTGRSKKTIHARLKNSTTGTIKFHADDIKKLAVYLPEEELRRAEALVAAGRTSEGLKMARKIVRPVIVYLDLPVEGAVEPSLRYASIARKEKAWAEAIKVYSYMEKNPDSAVSSQGMGWLAYCYMKNLQPAKAKASMEEFTSDDPGQPGFVPATLARSMLYASEGNDEAALDLAARAASLARIDHELYAEAMHMSADAYYRMSLKEYEVTEMKDVVLGRNKDIEEPIPPMLPEEFLTTATNQFARIIELFPSSTYAEAASNTLVKIEEELKSESEDMKPTGDGEQP